MNSRNDDSEIMPPKSKPIPIPKNAHKKEQASSPSSSMYVGSPRSEKKSWQKRMDTFFAKRSKDHLSKVITSNNGKNTPSTDADKSEFDMIKARLSV